MTYITARPKQIEIRSHWFQLLMYMVLAVFCGAVCWYVAIDARERSGEFVHWIAWIGIVLCVALVLKLVWNLLHAGEVMIRVSGDGVWIKGSNGGTTIPWGMVDDIYRPRGKQKQFLVLRIADEKYKSLNRGIVHAAIFQLNKLLGIQGMPLNIAGATVSHEQFESWIVGYWNDWKERHGISAGELGLKGKR